MFFLRGPVGGMEWGEVGVAQSSSQFRDLGKGFLEMVTFNCGGEGGGGEWEL